MKKSYMKPEVQVISYTLNDAIAASSCAQPLMNHAKYSCFDFKDNAGFPPVARPTFGQGENCNVEYVGYCYYTSTPELQMLFSS